VYVVNGDRLERRDPVTLAATASLDLLGGQRATSLAADPRASSLWVALTADAGPLTLVEIDLGAFGLCR